MHEDLGSWVSIFWNQVSLVPW